MFHFSRKESMDCWHHVYRILMQVFACALFSGASFGLIKSWPVRRKLPVLPHWAICLASVAALTFIYFTLSSFSHYSFSTYAMDTGGYAQRAWQYKDFRILKDSIYQLNPLGDHFEPILFVVAQVLHLWPKIEALFFVEAFLVALTFIPLYLLTWQSTENRITSFLVAISFALCLGTLNAIRFAIHPGTWQCPLYGFLVLAAVHKRWDWYGVCLLLLLMTKETAGLHLVGLGLFIALALKELRIGTLTSIFGLVVFLFLFQYHLPAVSRRPYVSHGRNIKWVKVPTVKNVVQHTVRNPKHALKQTLRDPVRIETLTTLLGSTGLLALLSPLTWLTIPWLFIEKFFPSGHKMASLDLHYGILTTAFVFFALALGLKRFRHSSQPMQLSLGIFVLLTTFSINLANPHYDHPLLREAWNFYLNRHHAHDNFKSVESIIPPEASVIALGNLVPHLAFRDNFAILFKEKAWNKFDYIVLTRGTASFGNGLKKEISKIHAHPDYEKVLNNDWFVVFRRRFNDSAAPLRLSETQRNNSAHTF